MYICSTKRVKAGVWKETDYGLLQGTVPYLLHGVRKIVKTALDPVTYLTNTASSVVTWIGQPLVIKKNSMV
jgi:hypothetical protein